MPQRSSDGGKNNSVCRYATLCSGLSATCGRKHRKPTTLRLAHAFNQSLIILLCLSYQRPSFPINENPSLVRLISCNKFALCVKHNNGGFSPAFDVPPSVLGVCATKVRTWDNPTPPRFILCSHVLSIICLFSCQHACMCSMCVYVCRFRVSLFSTADIEQSAAIPVTLQNTSRVFAEGCENMLK